jgi:hypothetical protein
MPISLSEASQLLSLWTGAAAGLGCREDMPPEAKEMSAALWGLLPAQAALLGLAKRHEAEWNALLLEQGKERWVPEAEPLLPDQRRAILAAVDPLAVPVLEAALEVGKWWRVQDGISALALEDLADAVVAYNGRPAHHGSTLESLFEETGETEELQALIDEKMGNKPEEPSG